MHQYRGVTEGGTRYYNNVMLYVGRKSNIYSEQLNVLMCGMGGNCEIYFAGLTMIVRVFLNSYHMRLILSAPVYAFSTNAWLRNKCMFYVPRAKNNTSGGGLSDCGYKLVRLTRPLQQCRRSFPTCIWGDRLSLHVCLTYYTLRKKYCIPLPRLHYYLCFINNICQVLRPPSVVRTSTV